MTAWTENSYKGWRDAANSVYVGQTAGRFWRVWQRRGDRFVDVGLVFPTAAAAKAHADTLSAS